MMRRNLVGLAVAVLGLSAIAHAKGLPEIKQIPCTDAVFSALANWEIPQKWRVSPGESEHEQVVSSPTSRIGVWIRLAVRDQSARLSRSSPSEMLEIFFDEPGCVPRIRVESRKSVGGKGRSDTLPTFADADLQSALEKGAQARRAGIVYVWSPRMNLSVRGATEVIALAKKHQLDLELVLDPEVPAALAEKAVKNAGLPRSALRRLRSLELLRRGLSIHYPALIFHSAGKLHEPIRPGYDDPARLEAYLDAEAAK